MSVVQEHQRLSDSPSRRLGFNLLFTKVVSIIDDRFYCRRLVPRRRKCVGDTEASATSTPEMFSACMDAAAFATMVRASSVGRVRPRTPFVHRVSRMSAIISAIMPTAKTAMDMVKLGAREPSSFGSKVSSPCAELASSGCSSATAKLLYRAAAQSAQRNPSVLRFGFSDRPCWTLNGPVIMPLLARRARREG